MAKKNRGKNKKNKKNKNSSADNEQQAPNALVEPSVLGDLRLIEAHVVEFLKGSEEAEGALKIMGRDAASTVARIAKEKEHEELLAFSQRLITMRPEVETNLFQLREHSILILLEEALASAPEIADEPQISDQSIGFSIFDPMCVGDVMIRTGRVRTDGARIGRGDLAIFPMRLNETKPVQLAQTEVPEGQATSDAWLRVQSGVVFVGPPEASDGERLGAIRFDPFSTKLNQHLERGGFVRVAPGNYQVRAYDDGDKVCVHLTSKSEEADGILEPMNIEVPPVMT